MKRMIVLVGGLTLLGAQGALGQGMVVNNQPLNPAQEQALDAVGTLRDSVVAAGGALAALRQDMDQKPANALEAQARLIADRCEAAERQRVVSAKQLRAQSFSEAEMSKGQQAMLSSMDKLKAPLTTCRTTYTPLSAPGKGEEVRGYGISRSKPVISGFDAFERTVVPAAKQMGIPVRSVLRAGPSPVDVAPAAVGNRSVPSSP